MAMSFQSVITSARAVAPANRVPRASRFMFVFISIIETSDRSGSFTEIKNVLIRRPWAVARGHQRRIQELGGLVPSRTGPVSPKPSFFVTEIRLDCSRDDHD